MHCVRETYDTFGSPLNPSRYESTSPKNWDDVISQLAAQISIGLFMGQIYISDHMACQVGNYRAQSQISACIMLQARAGAGLSIQEIEHGMLDQNVKLADLPISHRALTIPLSLWRSWPIVEALLSQETIGRNTRQFVQFARQYIASDKCNEDLKQLREDLNDFMDSIELLDNPSSRTEGIDPTPTVDVNDPSVMAHDAGFGLSATTKVVNPPFTDEAAKPSLTTQEDVPSSDIGEPYSMMDEAHSSPIIVDVEQLPIVVADAPSAIANAAQKHEAHVLVDHPVDKHGANKHVDNTRILRWREIALNEELHPAHSIYRAKFKKITVEEALAASRGDIIKYLHGPDNTVDGISLPIIFRRATASRTTRGAEAFGVTLPTDFNLNSLSELPSQISITVTDVIRQQDLDWKPAEARAHFMQSALLSGPPKYPMNIVSFECSNTKWRRRFQPPDFAVRADWSTNYANSRALTGQPACLRSISLGDAGSYTDFHVDFNGTTVFVTLLRGAKTFFFIPPTPENLRSNMLFRVGKGNTRFGEDISQIQRIKLVQGESMLIPGGWIYAVATNAMSIMSSSNILHNYNIPMQINVWKLEQELAVPDRLNNFVMCAYMCANDFAGMLRSHWEQPQALPLPSLDDILELCGFLREMGELRGELKCKMPSRLKLLTLSVELSNLACEVLATL